VGERRLAQQLGIRQQIHSGEGQRLHRAQQSGAAGGGEGGGGELPGVAGDGGRRDGEEGVQAWHRLGDVAHVQGAHVLPRGIVDGHPQGAEILPVQVRQHGVGAHLVVGSIGVAQGGAAAVGIPHSSGHAAERLDPLSQHDAAWRA
jgi:hypothetical protein